MENYCTYACIMTANTATLKWDQKKKKDKAWMETLLRSECRKGGTGDIHLEISKPMKMPTELPNEHVSALHHQLPCNSKWSQVILEAQSLTHNNLIH